MLEQCPSKMYQVVYQVILASTIDEEGKLRIKGNNETDHNTITTVIKTHTPRTKMYSERWNLANKEGWEQFNQQIVKEDKKGQGIKTYNELDEIIKETMKATIGKKKIRTDKLRKPKSEEISKKQREKKGLKN